MACTGGPLSIASFSIISNPNQNWIGGGGAPLCAALFFFSADVDLLRPLLFVPCGGEFASVIMKSGSIVKSFAAPLLPPCHVIWNLWIFPKVGVSM